MRSFSFRSMPAMVCCVGVTMVEVLRGLWAAMTGVARWSGAPIELVEHSGGQDFLKGSPTVQQIVQRVGESEGAPCGIIGIALAINDKPKHG